MPLVGHGHGLCEGPGGERLDLLGPPQRLHPEGGRPASGGEQPFERGDALVDLAGLPQGIGIPVPPVGGPLLPLHAGHVPLVRPLLPLGLPLLPQHGLLLPLPLPLRYPLLLGPDPDQPPERRPMRAPLPENALCHVNTP